MSYRVWKHIVPLYLCYINIVTHRFAKCKLRSTSNALFIIHGKSYHQTRHSFHHFCFGDSLMQPFSLRRLACQSEPKITNSFNHFRFGDSRAKRAQTRLTIIASATLGTRIPWAPKSFKSHSHFYFVFGRQRASSPTPRLASSSVSKISYSLGNAMLRHRLSYVLNCCAIKYELGANSVQLQRDIQRKFDSLRLVRKALVWRTHTRTRNWMPTEVFRY